MAATTLGMAIILWVACVCASLAAPCGKRTLAFAAVQRSAGSLSALVQYAPQLLATWRHRASGSLSLLSYTLQVAGGYLNIYQSITQGVSPWPVWTPWLISTSMQNAVLVSAFVFDARRWRARWRARQRALVPTAVELTAEVVAPEMDAPAPAAAPLMPRAAPPVIDSDRSFVAEALEPRYPFSSSVFVTRRNGEETLAYVKEYDAANKIYTVELEQRGSMKLKKCDETSLREANMLEAMFSPVAMFFSTRAMSSPAHIDNDLYDA
jgi:hypothetical protein